MKRIFIAIPLLAGLVAQAKTVAWWRMEGKTGDSAATVVNKVDPGTLNGIWSASGAPACYDETFVMRTKGVDANISSVRLGDGNDNMHTRHYAVTDNGTLRPDSLTAEAFVKWNAERALGISASAGILGYVRDNIVSCAYGFGFYGDSIVARFNDGAEKTIEMPAKPATQTGSRVLDGLWHHVAITFDGVTKKAALWVDYEKCGELVLDGPLNYVEGKTFNIGNYGGRGMLGWVDEVRISDSVLDVGEFLDARLPDGFFLDEHEPVETLYRYRMGDAVVLPPEWAGAGRCGWCKIPDDRSRLNCANWRMGMLAGYASEPGIPSFVDKTPAERLRFAAGKTNDFVDAKSASFTASGPFAVELPSADAICGGDFTAEFFACAEQGQGNCGLIRQLRAGSTAVLWQIGLDANARIVFSSWDGQGSSPETTHNVHYGAALEADRWHHVAVTYRAESRYVELFYDGERVNSSHLGYSLKDVATNVNVRTLLLGRRQNGFDGEIDEVRVTGRVLDPAEFLSFPDGMRPLTALVHFGFDGSWANDSRTCVSVPDASHEAHAGGSDPAISGGRLAGKYLYEGASRTAESFWSTNTHFVSISKGVVSMVSSANPFFASPRITTEAFVRFPTPNIENYTDVLAYSVGSMSVWTIRMLNNKPYVLIRGTSYSVASKSDAVLLNDGNWHHLALVLEENEAATETAVVLYVDGVPGAEGTVACSIPTSGGTDSYVLAAGTVNLGHYSVFDIDEVRISRKALAPSEFIQFGRHFAPSGLMLIFR